MMYNNDEAVSAEKLFASYGLMFEPDRRLWDRQKNYIRANQAAVHVKNVANQLYDHEVYSEVYNQNFDFPEIKLSIRFIWFEKFSWVYYHCSMVGWYLFCRFIIIAQWQDGTQSGIFLQKPITKTGDSSKNIQKTSKLSNKNTQKAPILIKYIFT